MSTPMTNYSFLGNAGWLPGIASRTPLDPAHVATVMDTYKSTAPEGLKTAYAALTENPIAKNISNLLPAAGVTADTARDAVVKHIQPSGGFMLDIPLLGTAAVASGLFATYDTAKGGVLWGLRQLNLISEPVSRSDLSQVATYLSRKIPSVPTAIFAASIGTAMAMGGKYLMKQGGQQAERQLEARALERQAHRQESLLAGG